MPWFVRGARPCEAHSPIGRPDVFLKALGSLPEAMAQQPGPRRSARATGGAGVGGAGGREAAHAQEDRERAWPVPFCRFIAALVLQIAAIGEAHNEAVAHIVWAAVKHYLPCCASSTRVQAARRHGMAAEPVAVLHKICEELWFMRTSSSQSYLLVTDAKQAGKGANERRGVGRR